MYRKECYGILLIPEDFSKKLVRGEQSPVMFYSDMSIMLNYKGFLMAITDVTMDLGAKLQVETLGGATPEQISMATSPVPYSSITMYNPESGFGSFLIPAILVLILQQSLVLGIVFWPEEYMNIKSFTIIIPVENVFIIILFISF